MLTKKIEFLQQKCHPDHTLMKISKDVLDERSELTNVKDLKSKCV